MRHWAISGVPLGQFSPCLCCVICLWPSTPDPSAPLKPCLSQWVFFSSLSGIPVKHHVCSPTHILSPHTQSHIDVHNRVRECEENPQADLYPGFPAIWVQLSQPLKWVQTAGCWKKPMLKLRRELGDACIFLKRGMVRNTYSTHSILLTIACWVIRTVKGTKNFPKGKNKPQAQGVNKTTQARDAGHKGLDLISLGKPKGLKGEVVSISSRQLTLSRDSCMEKGAWRLKWIAEVEVFFFLS